MSTLYLYEDVLDDQCFVAVLQLIPARAVFLLTDGLTVHAGVQRNLFLLSFLQFVT
jgi:hypothetical protein